jgi:hypothetical protein
MLSEDARRGGAALEVLVLGDAGLRVVRRGTMVYVSRIQEHDFNMPFQMAWPDFIPETDTPKDAIVGRLSVQVSIGVVIVHFRLRNPH